MSSQAEDEDFYEKLDLLVDTDPLELRDLAWKLYQERQKLREGLVDLFDEYMDALHQGSGEVPLSSPTWHMFLSTYEYAEQVIPRMKRILKEIDPQ